MIILDTNVVSEAMKPHPSVAVAAWTRAQSLSSVFITTITQAEIFYGIECLPDGKRREQLVAASERVLTEFLGRVLPFDESAAELAMIRLLRLAAQLHTHPHLPVADTEHRNAGHEHA